MAIIGGGIAGLSVAKFLAERGIPFILLEEHRAFFKKACGEGIVRNTVGYEFSDLYGSTRGIEREVWETIIHTKYGDISLEMPILMTDKRKIEEELARQAQRQGEIRMGERVENIVDGIIMPQELKPKIIVGADGCFSRVRASMGQRPVRCGIAAATLTDSTGFDPDACHVIIRKDVVRYGYAWFFPKKNSWNMGIGSYKKDDFRRAFARFRMQHPAPQWRGALLPIDRPLKTYHNNVLLVGDAAAHVFATIGEGIMPSIIAAQAAARAIERCIRNNFAIAELSSYEKEWKEHLGKAFTYSYYAGKVFFKVVKSEYLRHKLLVKLCREATAYYKNILRR